MQRIIVDAIAARNFELATSAASWMSKHHANFTQSMETFRAHYDQWRCASSLAQNGSNSGGGWFPWTSSFATLLFFLQLIILGATFAIRKNLFSRKATHKIKLN